jgi:hypothetical protein
MVAYASGNAALPAPGAAGSVLTPQWKAVVALSAPAAAPRVLRIALSESGTNAPQSPRQLGFNGGWYAPPGNAFAQLREAGLMRITYGGPGCQRVIEADLLAGDYCLPPCRNVKVEAGRYAPSASALGYAVGDVDVQAEISEGVASDYRPLTHTGVAALLAGTPQTSFLPTGTWALDIAPAIDTTMQASAVPSIVEVVGESVYLYRNYSTGQCMPPGSPVITVGGNDHAGTQNKIQALQLAATGVGYFYFRFIAFKR